MEVIVPISSGYIRRSMGLGNIAQGLTCGKITKALEELKLERNKKRLKRKEAEVECQKRMIELRKINLDK